MRYSTDIPDLVVRHYSFIFIEIKAYAKLNCLFGKNTLLDLSMTIVDRHTKYSCCSLTTLCI